MTETKRRPSKELMRRHKAALALLPGTTEEERVRLLAMVVAPSHDLLAAIEEIDERLDDNDAANFNLGG